MMMLDIEYIYI